MTDEERNRAVIEGHTPHARPDETSSDPAKDRIIRGESREETSHELVTETTSEPVNPQPSNVEDSGDTGSSEPDDNAGNGDGGENDG